MAEEKKSGGGGEVDPKEAPLASQEERRRFKREEEREARGPGLMTPLATGGGSEHRSGGTFMVIIAFLLFLFDIVTEYKGFQIVEAGSLIGVLQLIASLGYVVGVWAFFFWFLSGDKSLKALIVFIIVTIVVIISFAFAFKFDPLSLFHVLFILFFWAVFINPAYEDKIRSNLILIAILIVDLYLYSIIGLISPDYVYLLKGFPFLFIITILYVWQQTRNWLSLVFMIGVLGWYFLMGGPKFAEKLNIAGINIAETPIPSMQQIIQQIKDKIIVEPWEKVKQSIGGWFSKQVQYAVTGKVEENQFEPLGVYLENVKPADLKYYLDEDVIVWGTVKARTLDDPLNIKVGCFTEKDKKNIPADEVHPELKFSVFTLEEQDFACKFKRCTDSEQGGCKFKEGSNQIKAFADFNFETLSYLKVYFIDSERQRAMVREGLDIFKEMGIADKNPVAVYTNGPAKLEMGTNNPLTAVSKAYIVEPSLDIKISNREGWQGNIKKLKELVIFFPEGVTMTGCNKNYEPYTIKNCTIDSCEKIVKKECLEVCDGYAAKIFTQCENGCAKDDRACAVDCNRKKYAADSPSVACQSECDANFGKCQKSCDYFFQEGEQKYTSYSLDVSSEREKDLKEGIAFRCRFTPHPSKVLGNAPITTKSFRVKARYNYTVEKSVSVNIEKVPEGIIKEIELNKQIRDAPESAKNFFKELKASPYFSGFADALLWGLTSNARYESRFLANAAGDTPETPPGETKEAINVGGTEYCSFGYWQMNVCGGVGVGFINYYGINANNEQEVYNAITDKDKQFQYVSYRMKLLFPNDYNDKSKSAKYFAEVIAIKFEICQECGEFGAQTKLRGELAATYMGEPVLA